MSLVHLVTSCGSLSICHLQFPEKETSLLRRKGVTSIEDLVSELWNGRLASDHIPMVTAALEELQAVTMDSGTDWYAYHENRSFVFHHLALTCRELAGITADRPVFAISRRSFGNGGAMLERAGFDDFGKLVDGLHQGIAQVPGMGRKKYADFFARLVPIIREIREGGDPLESWRQAYPVPDALPAHHLDPSAGAHLTE